MELRGKPDDGVFLVPETTPETETKELPGGTEESSVSFTRGR